MQIMSGGQFSGAFCRLKTAALTVLLFTATSASPWAADEETSPWDWSASVRSGAGYKDNILLSEFFKESSIFTFNEADFFVFRVPVDGWELTSVLTGEDRRFWQSETVDKEQLLLATVDVKKAFAERWKAGWNLQYFYNDQVFDASVSEGLPFRVRARLHRFSGGPSLNLDLPGQRRVELTFALIRQNFELPLDDSWELGPRLLFAQKYGAGSEFTAMVQWRHRTYDTRASFRPEPHSLSFDVPEMELGIGHYWDESKHWKSRGRLGLELNEDNGAGFFDYRRWKASQELDFTSGRFEATLKTGFLHYEYMHQFVPDGRARRRTELLFGGRVRRELIKRLSLFAEAEHEWVLATDVEERYHATSVWAGLEWELK
jgi:hypothetical protein